MDAETVIEFLIVALDRIDQRYYGNRLRRDLFEQLGPRHRYEAQLEKYLERYGGGGDFFVMNCIIKFAFKWMLLSSKIN